ncbi:hypothetical protein AB6A40_003994 [Gnathostoma spinigerum]|uniref:Uncharacterized protein n=1 Tax=Gnathostoma spinigerum TaxID=75299 RepID=A0ABD6EB63_9BILA
MCFFLPESVFKLALSDADDGSDTFLPYASGQKRGLLRPYATSHSGPIFRNLPLFGFLAGLVIFFYIFYVYQAQNTQMGMLQEKYDTQQRFASKLKDENIGIKAKLESFKAAERTLQDERAEMKKHQEECLRSLTNEKSKVAELSDKVKSLDQKCRFCEASSVELTAKVKHLIDQIASLQAHINAQNAAIAELNHTAMQKPANTEEKIVDVKANTASPVSGAPSMNMQQKFTGINDGKHSTAQQVGGESIAAPPVKEAAEKAGHDAQVPAANELNVEIKLREDHKETVESATGSKRGKPLVVGGEYGNYDVTHKEAEVEFEN